MWQNLGEGEGESSSFTELCTSCFLKLSGMIQKIQGMAISVKTINANPTLRWEVCWRQLVVRNPAGGIRQVKSENITMKIRICAVRKGMGWSKERYRSDAHTHTHTHAHPLACQLLENVLATFIYSFLL